mgnify:CR=1 FL=1
MGAFMVFDVSFDCYQDRKEFEKKYNIKKKDILVDQNANNCGFAAYQYLRNMYNDVVYFMGFMGYGEPFDIVKECKKEGIKIKFLAWIPINDKNSQWHKERGKWE